MLEADVKPNANSIFTWGKKQIGANLISADARQMILTLLPRATAKFSRNGLRINGLRYKHDDYTEDFLSGGEVTVAYNPDDVTEVWLIDKGDFIPFVLIENRFKGKTLSEVQTLQKSQKQVLNSVTEENLQAQIDLAEHIEVIASRRKKTDGNIKNIRSTRKREQARTHIDFAKEDINRG